MNIKKNFLAFSFIFLGIPALGLQPSSEQSGEGHFKGCADWVNAQIPFYLLGPRRGSDDPPHLKINTQGDISFNPALRVVDTRRGKRERFRFPTHEWLTRWLSRNPDGLSTRDGRDFVEVKRDGRGRITEIVMDQATGGRGAFINGKRYVYYRNRTTLKFAYDERGCYPASGSEYSYVGNQAQTPRSIFNYDQCVAFQQIYDQLPKRAVLTRSGSAAKYESGAARFTPVIPPPSIHRYSLIESVIAMSQNIIPKVHEEWRALATQGIPFGRKEKRNFMDSWDRLISQATRKCHGIGWRDTFLGAFNLRPFMNARPQQNQSPATPYPVQYDPDQHIFTYDEDFPAIY